MLTDVGTLTNSLTFEPDPDHSPDAGTRLFSPISFKRCYMESDVYVLAAAAKRSFKMVLWPTAAARHGFNMVSLSQ